MEEETQERIGGAIGGPAEPDFDGPSGPEAKAVAFARALLGGDADAAANYFSPAGHCLTPDGTEISGRQAIAGLLGQLTASNQRLEIRAGHTVLADSIAELLAALGRSDQHLVRHLARLSLAEGLALTTQYWTRSTASGSGKSFRARTIARLVLAREAGAWQIAIASPWG